MITSPQHPLVKRARALRDPDARRRSHTFLAEGVRLLEEALESGLRGEALFYTAPLAAQPRGKALLAAAKRLKIRQLELSERLLASLKETKTSQGAIGLFHQPRWRDPWEAPLRRGLVVVTCQIRDPGNLGTIVRVSEAAGVRGLLLTKGTVDPFHPKVLRSSMGSLFRLPVVVINADELEARLGDETAAGAQVVAAVAHGGMVPAVVDLQRPTFVLVGHETEGIPPPLLARATHRVTIPMTQRVESLNVAVATAVLLYEALRQRAPDLSAARGR